MPIGLLRGSGDARYLRGWVFTGSMGFKRWAVFYSQEPMLALKAA
jgi:hypothetical protein